METETLHFDKNARCVYTAVKSIFRNITRFSSIDFNDDFFFIEARRGSMLSPFSEHIKIRVVASGTESCDVVLESSSRSILNVLNLGVNSKNVSELSDYIKNMVYKIQDKGEIRIVPPVIKMRDK